MTPPLLDYEGVDDAFDLQVTAGRVALVLASVAVALDGIALIVASGRGGLNWAFAFPCLCANGLLAPSCALAAVCVAVVRLTRIRGRDTLSWVALLLALGAGAGGIMITKWSADAVASV